MPECQNCGNHVTKDYKRVRGHPDAPPGKVKACPHCEDMVREGSTVRKARSWSGSGRK